MTRPRPPWEDSAQLAEKPAGGAEYGYVDQQGGHGCTREELVAFAAGDAQLLAVWTPDSPNLSMPEEVPFLYEAMKRRITASAKRKLSITLALFAAGMLYLGWRGHWGRPDSWPFLLTGIAGIAATWSAVGLASARRLTAERMADKGTDHRHGIWLSRQRYDTTKWISWCLIAVFAIQYISGLDHSMDAAGLIKSMVRLGQPWRLLTGPMLHHDPLHFMMNFGALIAFGRMTEVHAGRPYVPLVFIVSALGGSVTSTLLTSNASVGASGGLMGFVGFLAVLAWRRRPFLPPGFLRTVMFDLAGVVIIGVIGYAFIDNAAHLGGFLTGAGLGALLVPRVVAGDALSPTPWSLAPGPGVRLAGNIALAATVGASLMAVAAMNGLWQ
ncbi:MAG TPA: rhomboid family intramembrane serine protease [Gemmatimonadaceae bacterium]|nr:rhomboid family intramembrane serine protease [Gemmatimonadaceae bacterium]